MPSLALTVQTELTYVLCIIHSFMTDLSGFFLLPWDYTAFHLLKKRLKKTLYPSSGKGMHFLGFQAYSCPEQVSSVVDLTAKGHQASQHPAKWAIRATGPDQASCGSPRLAAWKSHWNRDVSLRDCHFPGLEFFDNIWYFGIPTYL